MAIINILNVLDYWYLMKRNENVIGISISTILNDLFAINWLPYSQSVICEIILGFRIALIIQKKEKKAQKKSVSMVRPAPGFHIREIHHYTTKNHVCKIIEL